ncbi:MAG: GntR family transcriptional regulator [Desulfopila sp.]
MTKRKNLTAKTYQLILKQLLQRRMVAGQRLIFVDLARQFGVSRTPVQNALSILERQGYVDLEPHKGYSVHAFSRQEIGDFVDLKQTMEEAFLPHIGKASASQLQGILRAKTAFETAAMAKSYRLLSGLDLDFHLAIAAIFDNGPALAVYREALQKLAIAALGAEGDRPAAHLALREHSDIYEAIAINDLGRATWLAAKHLPLTIKAEIPLTRPSARRSRLQPPLSAVIVGSVPASS